MNAAADVRREWQRAILAGCRYVAMGTVVVIAGVLMQGCQRSVEDNPLSPDVKKDGKSYESHQLKAREGPATVHLPHGQGNREITSVTDSVDAEHGGKIVLKSSFPDAEGKPVSITISLTFPPGALSQNTNVTVTLDTTDLITDIAFGPHGTTFNSPVLLDVKASGLDLTGYEDGSVDAWYVDQGQWVEMLQARKITVDVDKGKLDAKDVELHHFSRYAFGR